jgi:hypothetical protein
MAVLGGATTLAGLRDLRIDPREDGVRGVLRYWSPGLIGHKRAQIVFLGSYITRSPIELRPETSDFAGYLSMEPAEVNANRLAPLPGGRVSLDGAA